MRRSLVLANQTLGGEALLDVVRERIAAGEAEFYVVVPATPLSDQEGTGGPSSADRAFALAQQRLNRALEEIRALGGPAEGEVGDRDALEAVRLGLGRFSADEVIVSTLPLGLSRWLRGNLPAKIERTTGLPVVHVVATPESAG